ncbi:hypothetical protein [Mumia sp. DW29H23]|uniref:hypothetical protein n=1 Tax=Mumia sp. DW29H23 TaxID=3421241 RepID=UPI003D69520D
MLEQVGQTEAALILGVLAPWFVAVLLAARLLVDRVTVLRIILLVVVVLGGFWIGIVYVGAYALVRPRRRREARRSDTPVG